jgi:methionyl-tRNA formyltransferase
MAEWLSKFELDIAYCFGWSRLLDSTLLSVPRLGMVGFHPAELPMNRGRHPLIWALALGLKRTASTFFFMTEEADAGPIVSQTLVPIADSDDAAALYSKVTRVALQQIEHFTRELAKGTLVATPQDHTRATYWRKRTVADGRIDWRMSAISIRNLVRALAPPYPGATFLHDDRDVVVGRVEIAGDAPENMEPGRILATQGRSITVRVGDGALRILEHGLSDLPRVGSYL